MRNLKNNKSMILPGQTIGILGGGQLGRMMAISAREMGYKIAVLDPDPNGPCAQIADHVIATAYDDQEGARRLLEVSDVITYEFENVDLKVATLFEERGILPQGSRLLQLTQDRIQEKSFIQSQNVPTASFEEAKNEKELELAIERVGLPCVVKTSRGGYDGKGQQIVRTAEDISHAQRLIEKGICIVEQWIPFDKEIAVVLTRGVDGEVTVFPIPENVHVNHILHQSIVPARISQELRAEAIQWGKTLATGLELVGTMAIEMFVKGNELYVNELAPRPHNSGHYTIEACPVSQFDQHVRAICGLPLLSLEPSHDAVMVNVLGQHMEEIFKNISKMNNGFLHLYGKSETRENRKMGHITYVGESRDELLALIEQQPPFTFNK
ncbi:5-(carboxyamino)imidazole ribonucleotide synthase [Bacillaceae bacterium S4-13-56]